MPYLYFPEEIAAAHGFRFLHLSDLPILAANVGYEGVKRSAPGDRQGVDGASPSR
jgi:hypothetical protein